MEEHYNQHMMIAQKVADQEQAAPMLHQIRVAMVAENRVVMIAENRVVMAVENRVVMIAENRVVMVDILVARMVVVPAEEAREPDQVRTWHTNAERELLQRHNVDKNVETPVP
jgi:hypothetical protein